MARNRTISPDFWTWEAVIDCAPMTRLLFIGLWTFADDFGVQPLRPRTIRMQVFPGDDIDAARVRAMIEELAKQGLVRLYSVDGQDYVAIVDWDQFQRVGKRARRRCPSPRACGEKVPSVSEADEGLAQTIANHGTGETPQSPSSTLRAPSARMRGEKEEEWRAAIGARLRQVWPGGRSIEAMEPAGTERWISQWIADGCDLEGDVLAAVSALGAPPRGLHELALDVNVNRSWRLAGRSRPPAERVPAAA